MRSPLGWAVTPGILLLAAAGCQEPASGPTALTSESAFAAGLAPGQVIEIGTLGGETIPFDLSDNGVVVGTDYSGGAGRAFRWSAEGGIEPLETPAGWSSGAFAVNKHGIVVGTVSDGVTSIGVIWDASGERHDLPSPPPPFDRAAPVAISDRGIIGGMFLDFEAANPTWDFTKPFRWTGKHGYELAEYPGETELRWGGLNDRGDIVGSADPLLAEQFGIYLDPARGGMVEIGSMSGLWTQATDLNDHGLVVGYDEAPGIVEQPFVWTAVGGFRLLDGFADAGRPNRVNDRGEIVGFATADGGATQYGFFWSEARGLVDLGLEAGLSVGYAINKHGQVVGARASDGAAVLWTGFAPGPPGNFATRAQFRGVRRATASDRLPCALEGNAASRTDLLRCALR